jgi:acetoin utilization deacetylase AcuC-like enzyme
VVIPVARAFEPQLLLVSAGYDAHRDDPLATCTVTETGFAAMASSVRAAACELEVPLGLVLEGGYALGPLARSVAATLEALNAEQVPRGVGVAELASEARRRLSPFWPALS